ncbi:MAG: hypothetical protein M3126_02020 [Candidatus Eremiobacteraeota bacterium]|nr:hypothetical protein [Candidatus Eremiobacteraeota bacterium]
MIAQRQLDTQPRIRNVRTARAATQTRRKKTTRQRHAFMGRFVFCLGAVVVLLMGYVMLMANLTSLNYAVTRAEKQRVALQDQTARLDDRIAALRSQERLAGIAGRLGMRDAQQYAIVQLPQIARPVQASRLAVLSTLGGWLASPR